MVTEGKTNQGDTYEQNGNSGIDSMNGGEINDEAKVAGKINEAPSQKLKTKNGDITQTNTFHHHYYLSPNPSSNSREHEQECSVSRFGRVVSKDHKYNGDLVSIDLAFFREQKIDDNSKIGIVLTIYFGTIQEKFPCKKRLFEEKVDGWIRFGIKHGKLHLNFQNGAMMPADERLLHEDPKGDWILSPTGIEEFPTWEFEANQNKSKFLRGSRANQKLGFIDFLNNDCVVDASFKVCVNTIDLEVIEQDGVWNSETKRTRIETKIRLFFKKTLELKLEDYVSKVRLRYDSAAIS